MEEVVSEWKGEWVSVKDRLPERNVYVLVLEPKLVFALGYRARNSELWICGDDETLNVTHWLPIPPRPPPESLPTSGDTGDLKEKV